MKKNMEKKQDLGTQNKSSEQCTSTTCTCSQQQEEKEELAKIIRDKLHLKLPKKQIEEIIILWYARNFNKMPPQWLVNWHNAPNDILIEAMNERQEKTKKKHCGCSNSKGN